jgi:protocatechuate 3,4-dioxygenase beta subunit
MTQQPTADPRWRDAEGREIDQEDRGLVYDISTLVNRRSVLGLFGGVAAATLLAACATEATTATTTTSGGANSTSGSGGTAATGDLTEVPDETAGPYPGDGSNGVNVLDDSGIVRRDIRSSFGSSTTTVDGVPLTINLTVRDLATGSVLSGAGVYLWHCTPDGNYSLYNSGHENENYLRGVQEVDATTGTATFTSVFPGAYPGRWPHIHFEVYSDVATAVANGPIVKTSQIALPQEVSALVYADSTYGQSTRNLGQSSLATDNVFSDDGGIYQLATMTGSVEAGYTASLTIGV